MADMRYYGTGKRKTAIARVWIIPNGTGKITVNKQDAQSYFGRLAVWCTVKGGGKSAQADAIKFGIAKALLAFNPELRPALKKAGFLTRDARIKERKKYGQRGARARYQWSKR